MVWTNPRTWVAGEKPSAATLNQHVRDNFKAIGDAWTAYTPTTTNITLTGGTLTGHYSEAGKDIKFRIKFVLGVGSAITGSPTFTLPVNATAARTVNPKVIMFDTSGSVYKGGFSANTSTSVINMRDDASANISSTVPFPWATGDEIIITGSYEAA